MRFILIPKVAFLTEPEFKLDVTVAIGSGLSALPGAINDVLADKLKQIFNEKFVLPNRKYFRLPGSP